MLISGLNLLVGFACGLRLTLTSFVAVMLVALACVALLNFVIDSTLLTWIGQLALAAFCLQAGYLAGLLVRAWAED